MSSIKKAIVYKDIKELFSSKQVYIPIIIVPLFFSLLMPSMLVFGAKYGNSSIDGLDKILNQLPANLNLNSNPQKIIYTALNYLLPSLFLIIPVMSSSVIGASSIVGEKERKTLETLLYTPINLKELFLSKVIGILIPSYIITLISSVLFGIILNIGGLMYFDKLIFPNMKWIVLLLWLCPSVTILSLIVVVLASAKASTFQESQQVVSLIIIPIILLVVGQSTGLFLLNTFSMFLLGAFIFIVDLFLLKIISKSFKIEKLI
ncbi:ABC transporter permease subunit [Gottschalkia acidurici]|nr:ABC transporter permease subunit [Gottschalkia acidurici]